MNITNICNTSKSCGKIKSLRIACLGEKCSEPIIAWLTINVINSLLTHSSLTLSENEEVKWDVLSPILGFVHVHAEIQWNQLFCSYLITKSPRNIKIEKLPSPEVEWWVSLFFLGYLQPPLDESVNFVLLIEGASIYYIVCKPMVFFYI